MVTETGSYLRLIDFCITQLEAQGPSSTCNENEEEEEDLGERFDAPETHGFLDRDLFSALLELLLLTCKTAPHPIRQLCRILSRMAQIPSEIVQTR